MVCPVTALGTPAMHVPAPRWHGRTQWVAVKGGQLAVETIGSGPPVLLLHGWTLDRRMWAHQVSGLADRFTLIGYDRRGFGQSTAPPDAALEADDIGRIADAAGLKSFALVGMSQAGAAALQFSSEHAGRVCALVLQGISLPDVPDSFDPADRIPLDVFETMVRAGKLAKMKQLWSAHPLMAGLDGEAAKLGAAMLEDYDGCDLMTRPINCPAGTTMVQALTMPVLGITGSQDTPWRRAVTTAVGTAARYGEMHFVPEAGHMCNLSHPAAFNAVISDFLTRAIPSPRAADND